MIVESLSGSSSNLVQERHSSHVDDSYLNGNFPPKDGLISELGFIEEFKELLNDPNPVIVIFDADWCQPCKVLNPHVTEAIQSFQKFRLVRVNIDDFPELAEKYQVTSVPHIAAFYKCKPICGFIGFKPTRNILEFLKHVEQQCSK